MHPQEVQDPATADTALRALIVDSLNTQPGATLTHIQTRLRARVGRGLEPQEIQRLEDIYSSEGYASSASASVSGDAARARTLASLSHVRPSLNEILGLIVCIVPFFVHFQSSSGRPNSAAASYFDLVAVGGGILAIIFGLRVVTALEKGPQRPVHLALGVIILVLGVYQGLLGLGMLHRLGIYHL